MTTFGDEMEPSLEFTKSSSTDLYSNANFHHLLHPKPNESDFKISFDPESTSSPHICAGCEKPILDEFLSSVLNQWWHESCLKCAECGSQLSETCYSREGKTFCREDFYRYEYYISIVYLFRNIISYFTPHFPKKRSNILLSTDI